MSNLRCRSEHREGVDTTQDLVLALQQPLMRAAFLLTTSVADAEDLVQDVLVKVLLDGRRVAAADNPTAYARRMLVNTFLSRRRRASSRDVVTADPPDRPAVAGDAVVDRDVLRRALACVPARQRAAVVLRHYEDLSEQQTAELMGCSVGTVKSLTSRGLAGLRAGMHQEQERVR